jgi:hypothetical protein
MNEHHLEIIASLTRFHFVLDIPEKGLWYLFNSPSIGELARFSTT